MSSPETREPNVYAPPVAPTDPDREEAWSVGAAFMSALRCYRRTPLRAILALGLIPTLATFPFEFWNPVDTWLVSLEVILITAAYSLVVPGQAASAIAIARGAQPEFRDFIRKLYLAPKVFVLGLPLLLGLLPLLPVFSETPDGSFGEGTNAVWLALPMLFAVPFVALRLFIAGYALVDRDRGLRDAALFSWRSTGGCWPRYLVLSLLVGLLMLPSTVASLDGPTVAGTALDAILRPFAELAIALAYVSHASRGLPK